MATRAWAPILLSLLALSGVRAEEETFPPRLPPGMTFYRRPAPPGPQAPAPLLDPDAVTEGTDLHCGHVRSHIERATPEQMACIRGLSRDFVCTRGNVYFPEDTCDLRQLHLLERMSTSCGYTGAQLMISNRDTYGLEPGVPGAIYASVEWGSHWVAGVVDPDGSCWNLDPALGRLHGGLVPLREHLAMSDQTGSAGLAQVLRWNGRTLDQAGQYGLCVADCLGELSQALRGLRARSDDRGMQQPAALLRCIECRQDCGRRFGQTSFRFSCEQILAPRPRRSDMLNR